MVAHARLKNAFTEDEKDHNLMLAKMFFGSKEITHVMNIPNSVLLSLFISNNGYGNTAHDPSRSFNGIVASSRENLSSGFATR